MSAKIIIHPSFIKLNGNFINTYSIKMDNVAGANIYEGPDKTVTSQNELIDAVNEHLGMDDWRYIPVYINSSNVYSSDDLIFIKNVFPNFIDYDSITDTLTLWDNSQSLLIGKYRWSSNEPLKDLYLYTGISAFNLNGRSHNVVRQPCPASSFHHLPSLPFSMNVSGYPYYNSYSYLSVDICVLDSKYINSLGVIEFPESPPYGYYLSIAVGSTPAYAKCTAKLSIMVYNNYSPIELSAEYRNKIGIAIDIGKDISDAQIIIESAYFFTGNPIIPTSVNVYLDGTQLVENTDYTVGVTNNTYVGEANVNIAGIGNYTGAKQAHFTIARANIANANISVDGTTFTYTGQEIEPTVTITLGGYTAQRGVDYYLRYTNNVNIGTASIQIDTSPSVESDRGNFQGNATVTFQITGNDSPYEPGGTTEPEIGPTDGDWELINNPLDLSYTNHNDLSLGLFRAYAMDKTQLSNFGKTLWRPSILQSITALLSNPLNTIISLGSYPFTINATSSSETIEFNWIDDWIPDGWQFAPTGHPLNGEYQTFSFGTVTIPRYSGTFYDFQPYTQAQIYIPYIGYVNVKANEIIGKQIELQYHVNLITGDFTAIVFLSNRLAPQIIGEYQGNMLRELPLSMSSFVSFVGTAIKTTAIAGAAIAAFGAAAPLAATAGESAKNLFEDSLIQSDMGNYSYASILRNQSNQIEKTSSKIVKRDARRAGIAIGASAIGLITNANQPIPRNGTIGAVSGRTSTQEAFVSLSLPHQNIPSNQAMLGYPTNLPGPLSKFSGYTVVRDIHVKSSTALYSELIEIEKVVRGGIVI